MGREASLEMRVRMTPTAEAVRRLVEDRGWHAAFERWSWIDRRTLTQIMVRERKGLPPAGPRGRKRGTKQ
jgi:hypothetical protein